MKGGWRPGPAFFVVLLSIGHKEERVWIMWACSLWKDSAKNSILPRYGIRFRGLGWSPLSLASNEQMSLEH